MDNLNQGVIECSYHEPSKIKQSLGEEIGNAITHGLGFIFGIIGLILMYIKSNSAVDFIGVSLYSVSFLFLYISSTLYHSFKENTKVKHVFRILDHTSIFTLIAGTYTPIMLIGIGGTLGVVVCAIQWSVALIAILNRVVSPRKNTVLQVILCVLLGWSGIILMPRIYDLSAVIFWLILSGGLAYSGGLVFYRARFKYAHFIWHFFVLFGTILHFIAIYGFLL